MPSLASRIRWNSFFYFLSSVIRLSTNFLLFVGIARLYGAEAFGQFTAAHTLSTIFVLLADFGFDTLLATEIARQRDRATELAQNYLSLKFLFVIVATIAMMLVPAFQQVSKPTRNLIYILSFYVTFSSLNNFFFALFKGFEQLHHETKVSFGINIALLLFLVILGILHAPLYMVALAFVGTRIIGLILAFVISSKMIVWENLRFNLQGWKEGWQQVMVFGLHFLFGNLFFQLDTLLLAFWKGDHEVGIYQSVFKIAILALIIPDVAINTMMPVLSRVHSENEQKWAELGSLLLKTLFLIALPISMIFFVYAEQVIELVYGARAFSEAVPILRIFSVIVFVRFCVETYALMLTTSRRQKTRMLTVLLGTVMNYLLNFYMIPHYGIYGAALVSLATNIFVGAGYITTTRRFFAPWIFNFRSAIPFGITAVLALILWEVRLYSIWYIVPIAVIAYAPVLYFIGYTKAERNLVFALGKDVPAY